VDGYNTFFFLFHLQQHKHIGLISEQAGKKIPDQKSTMDFVKMAINSCLP